MEGLKKLIIFISSLKYAKSQKTTAERKWCVCCTSTQTQLSQQGKPWVHSKQCLDNQPLWLISKSVG
jgi:hypothetical protein